MMARLEAIGIDWSNCAFDVDQFRAGLDVELEHGRHDPETDVTGDDGLLTGKIAAGRSRRASS